MARMEPMGPGISENWATPPDLLADISAFLGDYHDPCPIRRPGEPLVNGLAQSWAGRAVYVNPPYGKAAITPWIRKALTDPVREIVLLIPARTDTAWFQPLWADCSFCFIRGRLRFGGSVNGAAFASVLVYRGPRHAEFAKAFRHRGITASRV